MMTFDTERVSKNRPNWTRTFHYASPGRSSHGYEVLANLVFLASAYLRVGSLSSPSPSHHPTDSQCNRCIELTNR